MTKNFLHTAAQLILDITYPRSCLGCGIPNVSLCSECAGALPPAPWDTDEPKSVRATFDYRDPIVKKMVWRIKYKGDRALIALCAELLYEELIGASEDSLLMASHEKPLLAPVPMTWRRKRERGFNQGELLVKKIAARDGGRFFTTAKRVLKKARETPSQTHITNRTKRLKNIRGSFAVTRPELVRGRHIIIIDDVYTTGGTLKEIMLILKKAGAKKVEALTIAH